MQDDFDRIIARATSANAAPTLLVTIFLGANDACSRGDSEYVPWATFEKNIRAFVETILVADNMANTKIILITPPPIGIPAPTSAQGLSPEEIEDTNEYKREGPGYKTYMNKKRYAEGIMRIAGEYEETGRVVGLNFWKHIIDAFLKETEDESGDGKEEVVESEMPPGCGFIGARSFGKGWFTDGLHLNVKAYNVMSRTLMDIITAKWPELAPDQLLIRNLERERERELAQFHLSDVSHEN